MSFALNLPVRARVHHGGPVDVDVVVITEPEEFLPYELSVIVRDDRVWDSKAMDDVKKNCMTCMNLILKTGRASIHFENLSIATSRCV
jgi:hypothetical protein